MYPDVAILDKLQPVLSIPFIETKTYEGTKGKKVCRKTMNSFRRDFEFC